ncbi:MAG: hydrogenase maturation protease [Thermoplasmata archaeon]|nr:hydrogenase maturation protease [Thermoplasmata archaeon]
MKTIVLGVGNPILQDDGVGIHVINELREHLKDSRVILDIAYTGGMNLLDMIRGFDKVILVDAIKQESSKTGEVKRFSLTEAPAVHSCNPHDVSLSEALLLAKQLGEEHLPQEIVVIGIVVKNTLDFGEQLSKEVASAVPTAVNLVLTELKNT